MKEMIESLIEKGYIRSQADLQNQSVLAWDMGRLVLIARCCFECGYITEEKHGIIWKKHIRSAAQCMATGKNLLRDM